MLTEDELAKKTVKDLKAICRENGWKGYSSLKKKELIAFILNKGGSTGGPSEAGNKKLTTRTVHSRQETEKKIEKNKDLMEARAQVAGVTVNDLKAEAKREKGRTPARKTRSSKKATRERSSKSRQAAGQAPGQETGDRDEVAREVEEEPARTTGPGEPDKQEVSRFQDLPHGEQVYILKQKVSKRALKILKMGRADFARMNFKKLEKLENALIFEQNRFTAYNPTDKMLRAFIQESIDLIRETRENKLNELEQSYLNNGFLETLRKNASKIKAITSRIDRYYTEMDAAREIVDTVKFKNAPFSSLYLATILKGMIERKEGIFSEQ